MNKRILIFLIPILSVFVTRNEIFVMIISLLSTSFYVILPELNKMHTVKMKVKFLISLFACLVALIFAIYPLVYLAAYLVLGFFGIIFLKLFPFIEVSSLSNFDSILYICYSSMFILFIISFVTYKSFVKDKYNGDIVDKDNMDITFRKYFKKELWKFIKITNKIFGVSIILSYFLGYFI